MRNVGWRARSGCYPPWRDGPILCGIQQRLHPGLHSRPTSRSDQALAVLGNDSIDVYNAPNSIGYPVHDSRDHHSAVAVTHEYDVVKILVSDDVHDVRNVGAQIDRRSKKMYALSQSGQSRPINLVAGCGKDRVDLLPVPPATPRSVNDHVGVGRGL